jgi:hypothetical protein
MRIAVLIIAICLVMILGLQSCTVMLGGTLAKDTAISGGGAVGILMAFLFLLGAAFSLGVPMVSIIVFTIAGALGVIMGTTTGFTDLMIWGVVSLVLAFMSIFGRRELRKKKTVGATQSP